MKKSILILILSLICNLSFGQDKAGDEKLGDEGVAYRLGLCPKKRTGVAPRTGTNPGNVAFLPWKNRCSSKSENRILKKAKFTFEQLPLINGKVISK